MQRNHRERGGETGVPTLFMRPPSNGVAGAVMGMRPACPRLAAGQQEFAPAVPKKPTKTRNLPKGPARLLLYPHRGPRCEQGISTGGNSGTSVLPGSRANPFLPRSREQDPLRCLPNRPRVGTCDWHTYEQEGAGKTSVRTLSGRPEIIGPSVISSAACRDGIL